MANVLPDEKRLRVLAALVDGNSVRATERMTEVNLRTILRFGVLLGEGAQRLHDRMVRDLACSMVEVDEIWSYVGKKQARVDPLVDGPNVGEAYTFVALDTSSRLAISFHVGKRDHESTDTFIADLRARLVVMPAMTSDGFVPYIPAIGASFGPSVDYAQTVKNYRSGGNRGPDHRYEPARDPFITKRAVYGSPNLARATTAHIERNNGTTRHVNGRIRRLCYAFSKKLENHRAAVALSYVHYNFCHVVKTLRVTPAMAAGITDHVWTLAEFMEALLDTAPADRLIARPLAHRAPEGPSRELPGARGFLRVVGGGKRRDGPDEPRDASPGRTGGRADARRCRVSRADRPARHLVPGVEHIVSEVTLEIVERGLDLLLVLDANNPPLEQLGLELLGIVAEVLVAEGIEVTGQLGLLRARHLQDTEEQPERPREDAESAPAAGRSLGLFEPLEPRPERPDGVDMAAGLGVRAGSESG